MRTTLALCKIMGMNYDEIRALPQAVYEVLIEDVLARQEQEA
jgi:hypothetical protein